MLSNNTWSIPCQPFDRKLSDRWILDLLQSCTTTFFNENKGLQNAVQDLLSAPTEVKADATRSLVGGILDLIRASPIFREAVGKVGPNRMLDWVLMPPDEHEDSSNFLGGRYSQELRKPKFQKMMGVERSAFQAREDLHKSALACLDSMEARVASLAQDQPIGQFFTIMQRSCAEINHVIKEKLTDEVSRLCTEAGPFKELETGRQKAIKRAVSRLELRSDVLALEQESLLALVEQIDDLQDPEGLSVTPSVIERLSQLETALVRDAESVALRSLGLQEEAIAALRAALSDEGVESVFSLFCSHLPPVLPNVMGDHEFGIQGFGDGERGVSFFDPSYKAYFASLRASLTHKHAEGRALYQRIVEWDRWVEQFGDWVEPDKLLASQPADAVPQGEGAPGASGATGSNPLEVVETDGLCDFGSERFARIPLASRRDAEVESKDRPLALRLGGELALSQYEHLSQKEITVQGCIAVDEAATSSLTFSEDSTNCVALVEVIGGCIGVVRWSESTDEGGKCGICEGEQLVIKLDGLSQLVFQSGSHLDASFRINLFRRKPENAQ